jgi:hypothetical protein
MFLGITVWGAEAAGYVWNVHSAEFLFPFAFLVSVVLTLTVVTITLWSALPALRSNPLLRSKRNLWCTAFAVLSAVACAIYIAIEVVLFLGVVPR